MLPLNRQEDIAMRWGWITIRGLWPAALLMAGGTIFAILIGGMEVLGVPVARGQAADWVFTGAMGAAIAWALVFIYRLRRWEAGDGPFCQTCSGPTGFVHDGKVIYGRQLPDYRRCYNCGRPTPEH